MLAFHAKLYTLRGVSAVYVDCNVNPEFTDCSYVTLLVRPGETGVVCRYRAYSIERPYNGCAFNSCGADPDPRIYIVERQSMAYAPAQTVRFSRGAASSSSDHRCCMHAGMFWAAELRHVAPAHRCGARPDRNPHHRRSAEDRRTAAAAAAEDRNASAVRAAAGSRHRNPGRDAAPTTAIQTDDQHAPVAAATGRSAGSAVPRTAPKSDPRRPLTQPEYPPSSRRAGEAGTVILEVYVLENGRVGDARVKTSSGFPRLDEAAVREVKRSWRLVPGTENGKPVADVGAVRRHIQAHGLTDERFRTRPRPDSGHSFNSRGHRSMAPNTEQR